MCICKGMKPVRDAAHLPESRFVSSRPTKSPQQFVPRDESGELGSSDKHRRRPYYLLKLLGVIVCGSVSLIALTVLFWIYHHNFQAAMQTRLDLEQRLSIVETKLKDSESNNAKLKEDCKSQTYRDLPSTTGAELHEKRSTQLDGQNSTVMEPLSPEHPSGQRGSAQSPW